MLKLKSTQCLSTALALVLGTTAIAPTCSAAPLQAQLFPNNTASQLVLPRGTLIPIKYEAGKRILLEKGEYLPLNLTVATDIKNGSDTAIPAGSEVRGQLEPAGRGVRFVARELVIGKNQWLSLNATSAVAARTETVKQGATTADILKGTFAGAGTATIIAGTTGDRRINALEVLGGAAFGALAGWALPEAGIAGGGSKELIAVDPNQDLTLTLQSDLVLKGKYTPKIKTHLCWRDNSSCPCLS